MRILARTHPFLFLAVLLLAVLITGAFWEAPSQAGAQGAIRLLGQAWGYAVWPIRFVLAKLSGAGVESTTIVTVAVLVCYVGLFVLLDLIFTKVARGLAG